MTSKQLLKYSLIFPLCAMRTGPRKSDPDALLIYEYKRACEFLKQEPKQLDSCQ